MSESKQAVAIDNVNPRVLEAEYAVRGPILIKANEYKKRLAEGKTDLPFDSVVFCNIGNPQALGQKPITFYRQVLSLLMNPSMLESEDFRKLFPADAVARAENYLKHVPTGLGAYSGSQGVDIVRQEVADYIQERDGIPSDPTNIFLSDGASNAIANTLNLIIADSNDALLIPRPQYPLYSATLAMLGGKAVMYGLDEDNDWSVSRAELDRALKEAKDKGLRVRALAVLNPGNPTGQCLTVDSMTEIIEFCQDNNLLVMADEVYQTNIYGAVPFTSFKKVVAGTDKFKDTVQLISYHSTSKGVIGECGLRGGYMELYNISAEIRAEFYKMAAVKLCPNLTGQITTGLMVNPPKSGDPSYELWKQETDGRLQSFIDRAKLLADGLNNMKNVSCRTVAGAMYAFPSIKLPTKFVAEAEKQKIKPDALYCFRLLDATGVCVVAGSGFGQKDGTYHFRTTILPATDVLEGVVKRMTAFNDKLMDEYAD